MMATISKHFMYLDAKHAKSTLALMLKYDVLPELMTMNLHNNLWNFIHSNNHKDINDLVKQQYGIMINKPASDSNTEPDSNHPPIACNAAPHKGDPDHVNDNRDADPI